MKYQVEISLLISGLFLFFLSTSDFLSYMAELLNTLFSTLSQLSFSVLTFFGPSFCFAVLPSSLQDAFYTNTAMNNSLR